MDPVAIMALATLVTRLAGLAAKAAVDLHNTVSGAGVKDVNTILDDADAEYNAIITDVKSKMTQAEKDKLGLT
jgi:hypothetical protein